ncbi:MAG: glycoside hydrolase family 3 N-terminal domain-containing protein, partial [Ruthenibacterium sp.]
MKRDNSYINQMIEHMSLEEKIGQTFTVICEGGTYLPAMESLISEYYCGGLRVVPAMRYTQKIFVNKAKRDANQTEKERFYWTATPKNPPEVTLAQYAAVLEQYQGLARRRKSGVPLRIAYDQEGGFSRDLTFGGALIFPPPMGLAATGDPQLAYEAANALGRLGRAVGVNMIHSPVLDINVEPANPEIYTRAYSDDRETVTRFARETIKGLRDAGMIATAKHFPGRGNSVSDAHFSIPVIETDWDTLWERELYPYRVLIAENLLPVIMTAHTIYPAVDPDEIATLSKKMLTGVLREKLGFEGVITTDAIGMKGVTLKYDVPTACVKALEAGADILLMRMSTDEPIGTVIPQVVEKIKQA